VRSMILGRSVLYGVAIVALLLTIVRRPVRNSPDAIDGIIRLYLVGIALPILHFTEEYVTRFYVRGAAISRARRLAGRILSSSSTLSGSRCGSWPRLELKTGMRVAFFPVWFSAIGMVGNAQSGNPLLSLATAAIFRDCHFSVCGNHPASCCSPTSGSSLIPRRNRIPLVRQPQPPFDEYLRDCPRSSSALARSGRRHRALAAGAVVSGGGGDPVALVASSRRRRRNSLLDTSNSYSFREFLRCSSGSSFISSGSGSIGCAGSTAG